MPMEKLKCDESEVRVYKRGYDNEIRECRKTYKSADTNRHQSPLRRSVAQSVRRAAWYVETVLCPLDRKVNA